MNTINLREARGIREALEQTGCAFLKEINCNQSIIELGWSLGNVVCIESHLPQSGIPTVQTLTPKHAAQSAPNQYSGNYGYGEFPLHTDLAHWAIPPRYLILRCKVGSVSVATRLLPWRTVISSMTDMVVQRALFRPRHISGHRVQCLLKIPFVGQGTELGYRWDELFLVPMNPAADTIANIMTNKEYDQTGASSIILTNAGDTLIIDNWLTLHGRSRVLESDSRRHVERVYLSRLFV